MELYASLDRPENPSGRVVINFNDAGLEPGLAFCGNSPDYLLIPDSNFFKSGGYAKAGNISRKSRCLGINDVRAFSARELVGKKKQPNFGNAASALMPDRESREA